jgi:hypothetical protein
MYNNEAVETLTEAVMDIITPKFSKYFEDRKSDITLQPEIDAIVNEIEEYEDLIDNVLVEGMPGISDEIFNHTINMGGYYFDYDKKTGAFTYSGDKEAHAKSIVWNKHSLYNGWSATDKIRTRVAAIITTMEETDFDSIVKKIEKDIDFNEFLN